MPDWATFEDQAEDTPSMSATQCYTCSKLIAFGEPRLRSRALVDICARCCISNGIEVLL